MQRADKRKFHYVYRIDRFDGKYYIGLHSTDIMEDGYFGSGTRLSNSLRYHGKQKHSKIILKHFDTRKEAKDYEKFLITDEMRSDTLCLNIAPGGGGGFINEQHHAKFQEASIEATKKRHKESGQPQKCLDALEQSRKPISKENSCDWNGRKHSEETKAKMRASHLARHQRRISELAITRPS